MNEYEMASSLPVFHESGTFKRPDYLLSAVKAGSVGINQAGIVTLP